MPDFPESPTLGQLQEYLKAACAERGWDRASDLETFLLFVEEVGEMARAIRDRRALFDEEGRNRLRGELAEELADVLSYVLDLANRFDVDLEGALRAKEERNQRRTWA